MNVPIFNTYINKQAFSKVNKVLESTFLSEGELVKEFETRLSVDFGLKNAVALNSGTSALHLALEIASVEEGDEVILPAQTFVATGLVILQKKAIPVFADIDYETGNISIASVKSKISKKTKAIMPVHWGGYPCDMDEINQLANEHNFVVIEDAAHALGATYKSQPVGSLSDYTCFSFQAIKHLTTGDGGAISFTNKKNADQGLIKRWFGIDRGHAALSILGERQYDIGALGFKYHMNDYAAALGIANMDGFFERLALRQEIAAAYTEQLKDVSGIRLFKYKLDRTSAYWLFGFHVDKREDFIRCLKSNGITASVVHQRIDRNSIFGKKANLPAQAKFDLSQIHIPIHDALNIETADYIIDTIKKGW